MLFLFQILFLNFYIYGIAEFKTENFRSAKKGFKIFPLKIKFGDDATAVTVHVI